PHLEDAITALLQGDTSVFSRYSWLSSLDYPASTRIASPAREFGIFSSEKLLPLGNEFGNRVIVEMNRGCTAACRFCVASYLYRPFRPASYKKVKEAIALAEKTGRGLALMGTSIGDYPEFDAVLEELADKKIEISLSSLKGSAITEKRLQNLKKCGVKTVTLAIESADAEVRRQIAKPLPQQTIIDALTLLFHYDFKVKLYFIAGLPATEPEGEIAAIEELLDGMKRAKTLPHITISVAPLSPKLLTPYADEQMMGKASFRRYLSLLKKMLKEVAPRIAIYSAPYREAVVQTWLTRTDSHTLISLLDGVAQGLSIRDAERAAKIKIAQIENS
ncbi:radical SAM protein, partial [bacterium]|nr:radical SAM protein [bacterium]